MTPNTRRVRQESLFTGPARTTAQAARGGLSVTTFPTRSFGIPDNAVTLWYRNDVYFIPSLMNLWNRKASSNGGDAGSLYGSGVTRMDTVDLSNEVINSVVQLPSNQVAASSGLGNITQRDLLVTSEHRLIVLANARPQIKPKATQAREPESPTAKLDQAKLSRGDLDIGGMSRMLDSMTGLVASNHVPGFGRDRKVGFAAH